MNDWERLISSQTLPNLKKACNKYLIPKVLCPFGCSEFTFKAGTVSLDLCFQRFLPKVLLKKFISNKEGLKYIECAREDFIRNDGDYDCWLFNDDWQVMPSIAIIDGVAKVLTCRDHNNGSKLYHIHPPRQPLHNLPSKYSDQLCHCVIRSRTIRPVQKASYSIGYQMHEQRGCFNGIDTCNVTSFRNFGFRSKLLSDAESRSILNRPDINALLHQLVEEKAISEFICNDKQQYAHKLYSNFNFDTYICGSTYVPFESVIEFNRENINKTITATVDNRVDSHTGERLEDITLRFTKYWPSTLFPCQKADAYGAMFARVPSFNTSKIDPAKLYIMWSICALLTSIQSIWTKVEKYYDHRTSQWFGWVLVYLTKHCLSRTSRHQCKSNPFKLISMNSMEKFALKFQRCNTLKESFADIIEVAAGGLVVFDLSENETGGLGLAVLLEDVTVDQEDTIIIDSFYLDVDGEINDTFSLGNENTLFELRFVSRTWINTNNKWDAEVFSRHAGKKWWHQQRRFHQRIHLDVTSEDLPIMPGFGYTLVYVKVESTDIEEIRNEFLTYLGGQRHVKCQQYQLCLVTSMNKKKLSANVESMSTTDALIVCAQVASAKHALMH